MKYKVGDIVKVVSEDELKKLNDLSWKHFRENHPGEVLNFNIIPPEFAEKIMVITGVECSERNYENIYGAKASNGRGCGLRDEAIYKLASSDDIISFYLDCKKTKIKSIFDKYSDLIWDIRRIESHVDDIKTYIEYNRYKLTGDTDKLKENLDYIINDLNRIMERVSDINTSAKEFIE